MAGEQSFSLGPSPAKFGSIPCKRLKEEKGSSQFENICIICWKRDRNVNLVNPKDEGKQKLFNSLIKCCDGVFYQIKTNSGFKSDD